MAETLGVERLRGSEKFAALPAKLRHLPEAGLCRHRAQIEKQDGKLTTVKKYQRCFEEILRAFGER